VGDMNAQVAACRTGEARFQAILDRFGYETYLQARDEIYRQSEQLEREAVAALPDGSYEASGFLDNDGLGHGPIQVQLRIDGEDGLINNVNGGFKDYPVEVFEVKYPALIRRYAFRPDTGGAGRFRGGCGVLRSFEVESDSSLYLWLERSVTPGWGLFGGGDAVGPDVV